MEQQRAAVPNRNRSELAAKEAREQALALASRATHDHFPQGPSRPTSPLGVGEAALTAMSNRNISPGSIAERLAFVEQVGKLIELYRNDATSSGLPKQHYPVKSELTQQDMALAA